MLQLLVLLNGKWLVSSLFLVYLALGSSNPVLLLCFCDADTGWSSALITGISRTDQHVQSGKYSPAKHQAFLNSPVVYATFNMTGKIFFFHHLRNIAILKFFSFFFHLYLCHLKDCYNSLLAALPEFALRKLQLVLNAAARLTRNRKCHEHAGYISLLLSCH